MGGSSALRSFSQDSFKLSKLSIDTTPTVGAGCFERGEGFPQLVGDFLAEDAERFAIRMVVRADDVRGARSVPEDAGGMGSARSMRDEGEMRLSSRNCFDLTSKPPATS